ncbi:A/G-specific adenine glycosylase [hydrothermal vent metagenome]|uniref:Adenine DNA glycosylase n=1 Tax=hydrothermal vent metagenome TaxID=652676 RepID=A0A3B0TMY3_9ZZZZ
MSHTQTHTPVLRPRACDLLAWYDAHARTLPWRSAPGEATDPYRIWLSEIMLQQTTVAAARPYFESFVAKWPDISALAAAAEDRVLAAWAGLGYYARARNLIRCAAHVAGKYGGRFPTSEEKLLTLPGIGPYTAAAIAAIAFGRRAVVVDGNVERVMARLMAVKTPLPGAKPELRRLAATLTPRTRPGDYAQAVMDLGATVCRPKTPLCHLCPWAPPCRARAAGIAGELPIRAKKRVKPVRYGVAFWVQTQGGQVLLRRRPDKGLLGAMTEIPSTEWKGAPWGAADARLAAPLVADWQPVSTGIRHVFTHFSLELTLWKAMLSGEVELRENAAPERCRWVALADLEGEALPSVMRKIVAAARLEL